ncbi:MAG: molybdopterin cofactor-binding domain-containing protein [Verrucomicrobiota bacterium]
MSDSEDNITPFSLPGTEPDGSSRENRETFGERLRRRRRELGDSAPPEELQTWQARTRTLTALVLESPHPAGSISRKRKEEALTVDGVEAVLFAEDLPAFQNTLGKEFSSEPLLAENEVFYRGQPVALIIGSDRKTCRLGASKVEIDYHAAPGIVTLDQAIAMDSHHGETRVCERGKASEKVTASAHLLEGTFSVPAQQIRHASLGSIRIEPTGNDNALRVEAQALLPTSVRTAVALAAELPESEVHLEPVSIPGMAGALETSPARLAALATHALRRCGCAIEILVEDEASPLIAGTRHATRANFKVAYEDDGKIAAVDLELFMDGGWFEADSFNSLDRALLHADAVYGIPHLSISGRLVKTNHLVATCLPAEGSAQGSWAMEEIVERVAEAIEKPAHLVRERNFYGESHELKTAPCGQTIDAASIHRVWNQVLRRSEFAERIKEVQKWNRRNAAHKRGIGITPIKFGVGDPRSERNAAAVIVQILADGSVMVRAGLVDLNDGLEAQIREEVSRHLGVEESAIRVILNDFDSLPRATPVTGTDSAGLVLRALDDACRSLLKRLREVALQLFAARGQTEIELESIRFRNGVVGLDIAPTDPMHFREVIEGAWRKRVNLIETGYHRTPNLWWDAELGAGWPFTSFTYAAAVVEIQVDAFTGEIQLMRLDVAHEGSPSPNQNERDFAQLMRAFNLGTDWFLADSAAAADHAAEAELPPRGNPGFADAPFEVVTDRLRPLGNPDTTPGDPCGEAPVLLAFGLRQALRVVMKAFGLSPDFDLEIPLPSTPPSVLSLCRDVNMKLREEEAPNMKPGEKDAPAKTATEDGNESEKTSSSPAEP